MSNDVVKLDKAGAIALSKPPQMSEDLTSKLENLGKGTFDGTESFRPVYPIALIDEAKAMLVEMETRMAPPPADFIELWCNKLRGSYSGGVSETAYKELLQMIRLKSGDLPAWVWCRDALIAAMDEHPRFFPSAGELDKLLRPRASPMRSTAYWLRFVANARVLPPPAPEDETLKAIPPLVLPPGMRSKREAKS